MLSIPSNFLFFSFSVNPPQFLLPDNFHEDSSNTVYSANKEMDLRTGYEPKAYYLMETDVESLTESLTQPQFPEQRFLEDVGHDDAALGMFFGTLVLIDGIIFRMEATTVQLLCTLPLPYVLRWMAALSVAPLKRSVVIFLNETPVRRGCPDAGLTMKRKENS